MNHPQQLLVDSLIAFDQRQTHLNIFQWIHGDPVVIIHVDHQVMRVCDHDEWHKRKLNAIGIDIMIKRFGEFIDFGGGHIGRGEVIGRAAVIVCDKDSEPELIEAIRDMMHLHRI